MFLLQDRAGISRVAFFGFEFPGLEKVILG